MTFQLPIGSGSCSLPIVAGYCASGLSLASTAVTVSPDFETTIFAAFAGACNTLRTVGTTISSPALSSDFPGFSRCISFGLEWNLSEISSRGLE